MSAGAEFAKGDADATGVGTAGSKAGNRVGLDRPCRRPILAPWQEHLAKSHMRLRLGSTVAIAEVALNCRLSLSYFERGFKNSVGIPPYAWLLQQRLDQAKSLLRMPAKPIAEIALDCGFADQAHFTNTFSRKFGVTPNIWRKLHSRSQDL